jgi:hypothetical protein
MWRNHICFKQTRLNPVIKRAYFLYFGCKVGDQEQELGAARVLHILFIKAQRLGESQTMFHAVCSTHDMEGAEKSSHTAVSVWCLLFRNGLPRTKSGEWIIQIYRRLFVQSLTVKVCLFQNPRQFFRRL